jgi:hypothetical protein
VLGQWSQGHQVFIVGLPAAAAVGNGCRCDVSQQDPHPTLYRRIATKGFNPDDFVTEQVRWGKGRGPREPLTCIVLGGGRCGRGAAYGWLAWRGGVAMAGLPLLTMT